MNDTRNRGSWMRKAQRQPSLDSVQLDPETTLRGPPAPVGNEATKGATKTHAELCIISSVTAAIQESRIIHC